MSFTPAIGSNNWDDDLKTSLDTMLGMQVSPVSTSLDGNLIACRERVEVEIARMQAEADKARLDFELVRLLKCAEAMQSGFTFHPNSPYAAICADVVPLNTYNQIVMNEAIVRESEGEDLTGLDPEIID